MSPGPLFQPGERSFAEAVVRVAKANPFLPERVDRERDALGRAAFVDAGPVWSFRGTPGTPSPNIARLGARLHALIDRLGKRIEIGVTAGPADWTLYLELCLYALYDRYDNRFEPLIDGTDTLVDFYDAFLRDYQRLFRLPGVTLAPPEPAHLFACFFQIRRAFHHIYVDVLGASLPAAYLRGAVWESIFSSDMRLYQRTFYRTMDSVSLLITGPTGSGKELVAGSLGRSRYVPYDVEQKRFALKTGYDYHARNFAELSLAVRESEIFGHVHGSFTGAVADKLGWLGLCGPHGTLFVDEVGELDLDLQIKLLRVLQTREFYCLGGTDKRRFHGKLITATHRDLDERIASLAFRQDFYYRICADRIVTPTLRAQLDAAPEERLHLVQSFAARLIGPEEAALRAERLDARLEALLPPDYPWPGNMRELDARVCRMLMHEHTPPEAAKPRDPEDLGRAFVAGTLSANELLKRYATLVFAQTSNYREAARRLGIDRRRVPGLVDKALLARLTGQGSK